MYLHYPIVSWLQLASDCWERWGVLSLYALSRGLSRLSRRKLAGPMRHNEWFRRAVPASRVAKNGWTLSTFWHRATLRPVACQDPKTVGAVLHLALKKVRPYRKHSSDGKSSRQAAAAFGHTDCGRSSAVYRKFSGDGSSRESGSHSRNSPGPWYVQINMLNLDISWHPNKSRRSWEENLAIRIKSETGCVGRNGRSPYNSPPVWMSGIREGKRSIWHGAKDWEELLCMRCSDLGKDLCPPLRGQSID